MAKKETAEQKLRKLGIEPRAKAEQKLRRNILMSPELYHKFKERCRKLGVSMNKVVVAYIEKFCEGDE